MFEVMVAIAIFSLVAVALMQTVVSSVKTNNILDEKILAGWVADNRLALSVLDKRRFTPSGEAGEEQMNGKTFYWRETGYPSPLEGFWVNHVEVKTAINQRTSSSIQEVWIDIDDQYTQPL